MTLSGHIAPASFRHPSSHGWISKLGPGWFVPWEVVDGASLDLEPESKESPSSAIRTVYLTFDDGPGPNTHRLAELLLERNMHASFYWDDSPEITVESEPKSSWKEWFLQKKRRSSDGRLFVRSVKTTQSLFYLSFMTVWFAVYSLLVPITGFVNPPSKWTSRNL